MRSQPFLFVLAVLLVGCGRPDAPPTAGGHPTAHWLEQANSPDPKARKQAVTKLAHLGAADPAAVSAVAGAVTDKDRAVRKEAVLGLLNLGPAARDAAPALAEAAKSDPDPAVRQAAAKALERVRGAGP